MRRVSPGIALSILIAMLVVVAAVELSVGPMNIPVVQVIPDSWAYFHGGTSPGAVVMGAIRLPRLCVAILVGMGLAASGTALQAIFRNPMADPSVIGVSSGGSLGAILAIATGLASRGLWYTPLAAFVCGLIAMFVVYRLGTIGGRTAIHSLLLSGVAIGSFCSAVVTLFLSLQPSETMQQMLFWLMGGLDGSSWFTAGLLLAVVLLVLLVYSLHARAMDIVSLGEEQAQGVGVNLQRVKQAVLVAAALLVGTCVSITGVIGFVGLIIPHLLRLWIGPGHRLLIPASALGGATLLVAADIVARMAVSPIELNIGVVTSLLGVPFFLYLLRKQYAVVRGGGWR